MTGIHWTIDTADDMDSTARLAVVHNLDMYRSIRKRGSSTGTFTRGIEVRNEFNSFLSNSHIPVSVMNPDAVEMFLLENLGTTEMLSQLTDAVTKAVPSVSQISLWVDAEDTTTEPILTMFAKVPEFQPEMSDHVWKIRRELLIDRFPETGVRNINVQIL